MTVEAFAPAKINLTLHVTGRRADGYHLLDSLVVFADAGDRLRLDPDGELSLTVTGPMAAGVPSDGGNLILKAAQLAGAQRGAFTLEKNLPAAAGIGGGSSDAAAALRALGAADADADALSLGADVPVCLLARAARMTGIGEGLQPLDGLPELPAVLVNPRLEISTPAVFKALARRDNPPMGDIPAGLALPEFCRWLAAQRNDLEAPARALQPEIAEVLTALSGAVLARMSGSGATCFGIYPSRAAAEAAAAQLSAEHPGWWVQAVTLT